MRLLKLALAGSLVGGAVFYFYSYAMFDPIGFGFERMLGPWLRKLPRDLGEFLGNVATIVILGAPVIAASLGMIQCLGPKPGRLRWAGLLGLPVLYCLVWSILLCGIVATGVLKNLPLSGAAEDIFTWVLLASPILLWNLAWAWEAVRRERALPAV